MNTNMPTDPKFNDYYQKHLKLLKLSGFQPKTIEAYSRALRRIGNYFDCKIYELPIVCFYSNVLKKTWEDIPLVKPPRTSRIPDILTIEELQRLITATRSLSYKVFFFTVYSLGLRLGEGIELQVGDINSTNMKVHVRDAKGRKDRLVPLPEKTLQVLRNFWRVHKHPRFIFPNRKRGLKNAHLVDKPLDRSGIQTAMKTVVTKLKIKKKFHVILFVTVMRHICWRPELTL